MASPLPPPYSPTASAAGSPASSAPPPLPPRHPSHFSLGPIAQFEEADELFQAYVRAMRKDAEQPRRGCLPCFQTKNYYLKAALGDTRAINRDALLPAIQNGWLEAVKFLIEELKHPVDVSHFNAALAGHHQEITKIVSAARFALWRRDPTST